MEGVKEYLLSKYFSSFGYIVAVLHLPALVIFLGFTVQLRTSERRTFRCPSSPDFRDDCLAQYDEQYNSPFPLYGFVLLCFGPQLAVCIAYSWCFVKSRVDELETALKADPENPRRRPRVTTRRVFYSYLLHLLVRLLLGILFIVLQNFEFYPNSFPTKFVCVSATVKPIVNSTNFNTTKDSVHSAIDCDNSVGSDNATWGKGIWIVNILFALLVFGELCYILARGVPCNEFTFDSEFCQRHLFNKSSTPVTLHETTLRMKRRIREDTEVLEPLIAQPELENNRLLDDVFVDLVIYTGRAEHEFTDLLRRHEIFDIYLKPQHGSVPIKKLEELFLPNEDTQNPRRILVVGRPGIGKSLLCTKLSRDWSNNDLLRDGNKRFEHLFLFKFRWFNTAATTNISLKQLLSRVYSEGNIDSKVFQEVLDNPEKVLFIFDGLDEFKHHESCLEEEQAQGGNSPTEEMPFSALYIKLVKGKQLSGATVLTTCRPNVVQSISGQKFDRRVEIMGFTPEKVQEYVHKFCGHDAETVNKIWGHISSNLELLSLCYIPVNSFIVCSLLEKLITLQDQNSGSTLPTTSTEVYEAALRLFIFKHHPEFKGKLLTKNYLMGNVAFSDTIEETLSQVGSLAKAGIKERRLVFDSTEVQGIENCGLFNRMPDSEISLCRFSSHFCFIHLTLQELLAAREIAKIEPSDLSAFIFSNVSDPKWHLVIQFVAGLLRGQENEAVNSFVSILHESLTEEPPLSDETKQKAILMMKCLYEYNNETTVEKAASELQKSSKFRNKIDLSHCQVTPADCTAIVYFIKHVHELTELDLSGNKVTGQGVAHLCDALKDVNCKLTELDLSFNNITDQGLSHLCDALRDVSCKLTKLNLGHNNLEDQGVLHLCDALKDVNCKLTELNLYHNNITDQGVSCLCYALKDENCKLTKLNLRGNSVTEQGVSHLSNALKDVRVHWKLTVLNLTENKIGDQGVSHLRDALKNVNCSFTDLNIRYNNITDQGVSWLSDALKDANCKLTKLNLRGNCLTDQGVSCLCNALKDENCKLTKLNFNGNQITNQGVSFLCDVLKDVDCKLDKLDLSDNKIESLGASHLCDALKDVNCKLTKLDLGCNSLTDQGLTYLCDALKDVNCKLTKLHLNSNKITEQGASDLCGALKDVNCKLTSLDLHFNCIRDQGVSHLCDALKDVNCKLTKLDLGHNNITDQGVSYLCDALKHVNCKLTKLYLTFNFVTVQGLSHLCATLKDEHCNPTKLDLRFNNITPKSEAHLHCALKDDLKENDCELIMGGQNLWEMM